MAAASGQCLCGAVRFTSETVETQFHVCHCGMCRRWAGGPSFGANADDVRFDGEDNIVRYRSSDWAERGFCRKCGSGLFYLFKPTGQYMISLGLFDEPADFTLAEEIYIDHKPGFYALAGDHPKRTEAEVLAAFSGGDSEQD